VGEATGDPVRGVAELEPLQQVAAALLPVGQAAQPGGELEVLPRRGPRDQPAHVGAVADRPLDLERLGSHVVAGDQHGPGGRRHDTCQHPHGGGLAGAVAAQERGGLAGVGGEVDAGDSLHLAEADMEAADVDDGRVLAHPRLLAHPKIVPDPPETVWKSR
jgi:hypothetical protein